MKLINFSAVLILDSFLKFAANAQTSNLPPDIARTLHESQLEHDEAMRKRFQPIIQDLSSNINSDCTQLYSNAVQVVFFSNDTPSGAGWRDWQKENKDILEDTRLPLATKASALYLQGHLYLILGREDDANTCFIKILNIVSSGPQNLAGFHLMQESLTSTLLFKYYQIPPEYLNKDTYCGSISGLEDYFKELILPNAIKNDPKNIESYWNLGIAAIGNVSSLSDNQRQKYAVDDYPRLVLEEVQCMMKLGQKKQSIYILEKLLSSYPDSPRYKEISDALVTASSTSSAVSTPAISIH